jgi:DNA-binding response OmpR family regulator
MNKTPFVALVDDDPQIVKLLKLALEESGYEVAAMTSGATVLSLIEKRVPDLLILDLNMPEPDGFDLLKTVRAEHPYLRMIVMSGLEGPVLEAAGFLGATATLEKPFEPDAMVRQVREVLGATEKPTARPAKDGGKKGK